MAYKKSEIEREGKRDRKRNIDTWRRNELDSESEK